MKIKENTIKINGVEYIKVEYIKKDSIKQNTYTPDTNGLNYVIIRTYSAGVHAGFLKYKKGKEVILVRSRRLWYWDGAFTLSQIAMEGLKKPANCKFSVEVDEIILTEAVEIIKCTDQAKDQIRNIKSHEFE